MTAWYRACVNTVLGGGASLEVQGRREGPGNERCGAAVVAVSFVVAVGGCRRRCGRRVCALCRHRLCVYVFATCCACVAFLARQGRSRACGAPCVLLLPPLHDCAPLLQRAHLDLTSQHSVCIAAGTAAHSSASQFFLSGESPCLFTRAKAWRSPLATCCHHQTRKPFPTCQETASPCAAAAADGPSRPVPCRRCCGCRRCHSRLPLRRRCRRSAVKSAAEQRQCRPA